MDYEKLITRYMQFGGDRLVIEYVRNGALGITAKEFFKCVLRRQSFKTIYPKILKKIEPYLEERYTPLMRSKIEEVKGFVLEHQHSKIVWFCWLQGMVQAPPIVISCYNSIKKNLKDREIRDVDNEKLKGYVELPDYIINKWEKGRIPAALFSDLLRLELLIKYGGT